MLVPGIHQSVWRVLGTFAFTFLAFTMAANAQEGKTSEPMASDAILAQPAPVQTQASPAQTQVTPAPAVQPGTVDPGSQMLPSVDSSYANAIPMTTEEIQYVQSLPCECEECASVGHHGNRTSLRENLSATTCFNCRTNGSYKFPVPRQYTYFWPGIYSQKTMTEYVAPYQGLKLRSPSEVFDSESESGN